jgi:hypothetical protein
VTDNLKQFCGQRVRLAGWPPGEWFLPYDFRQGYKGGHYYGVCCERGVLRKVEWCCPADWLPYTDPPPPLPPAVEEAVASGDLRRLAGALVEEMKKGAGG